MHPRLEVVFQIPHHVRDGYVSVYSLATHSGLQYPGVVSAP